jgi:hypothetical protein
MTFENEKKIYELALSAFKNDDFKSEASQTLSIFIFQIIKFEKSDMDKMSFIRFICDALCIARQLRVFYDKNAQFGAYGFELKELEIEQLPVSLADLKAKISAVLFDLFDVKASRNRAINHLEALDYQLCKVGIIINKHVFEEEYVETIEFLQHSQKSIPA